MRRSILILLLFLPLAANASDSMLITDPALLSVLEQRGLSFSARLGARRKDNRALAAHPGYKTIANTISTDLEGLRRGDPQLGVGMAWTHRLFDARWLTSAEAHYELAAIVPRLDRRSFQSASCGELRSVYRLVYRQERSGKSLSSKLPLTVNLVNILPEDTGGGCATIAQKWLLPITAESASAPDGPLSPRFLSFERIKTLEVNLQALRWPSTVRPDFGNHAEYLLRVFVFPTKDSREPAVGLLENTPDVGRLANDPALRQELKDWIRMHHLAFDEGHEVIPERFLAKMAISVAPRGSERVSNHPFSRIFKTTDFQDLPFDSHTYTKTSDAFLRRLDDMSCSGCHQNRSIAGFHLLGIEAETAFAANSLAVRGSPHSIADLPRRLEFVRAETRGTSGRDARPLSERAESERGTYGARCGLGDPSFALWSCEAPLLCTNTGDSLVGECLPPRTGRTGDPCQPSSVVSYADSRKDRTTAAKSLPCEQFCETSEVGFPRGMCSSSCDAKTPGAVCGGIAILQPFNACLARGNPFEECITGNFTPAELRECSEQRPCRDDYVCARVGSTGGCIPPYFLFQLRVDGHPTGREGLVSRIADRVRRAIR